jgi:hypothetical protein
MRHFPVIAPCRALAAARTLVRMWVFLPFALAPALAREGGAGPSLPSLRELEAAGAVIGETRISSSNIFDLNDPRENKRCYRFGKAIHVPTGEGVLLFGSGDRVSAQVIFKSRASV